jgi:equilibrative nucleoside transporter 1/2/3
MTVAAVVICGLADGIVGGSLIGSAGKLPKQYMQAVFAGTASSGKSCFPYLNKFLGI